jgi:hypothetical protein
VFGVLKVILRHDPVPGPSFGACQGQIAFIVSLKVSSIPRLGAGEPGSFIFLGGSGSSRQHCNNLRIWAWLRHAELLLEHCRVSRSSPYSRAAIPTTLRRLFSGAAVDLRMRNGFAVRDEAIAFGYPRERVF